MHRKQSTTSALVLLTCSATASIKTTFLGVQPSECQKNTAETRNTSSDIHPGLAMSSFVPWDRRDWSFCFANDCLQISVHCHEDTPPDVRLRSSLPAFSSVILAASAASFQPRLASLLNAPPFLLSSFCARLRRCQRCPCTSSFSSSAEPFCKVHLRVFLHPLFWACSDATSTPQKTLPGQDKTRQRFHRKQVTLFQDYKK